MRRSTIVATLALGLAALLAPLALGLSACGTSPCAEKCEEIRDVLLQNFGLSEAEVDCDAPMWDEADDCQACKALLKERYDVIPEDEDFCDAF